MEKRLRLSENKALFGVCGGIAEFFGISPTIVRIIFILVPPGNIAVYLVLAIYLYNDRTL
ncbi:PspC domain-containing protein [Amphibacillus cookii]|uniref:PspC domain-containing protein n=1 Tax=Amphibacillus cookii TaxID=767787 RepID=UPI00195DBCA5|nr:PspC domain-containing protein [Amphibacillus cookii]MBM7542055.1 phage shock protein PspC (stress-responsive transcriptional regulator) [Amphibacillus cookii]